MENNRSTFRSPLHKLEDDQVYVYFGNTVGRVETTTAYKLFGAMIGRIDGAMGKCYAICSYEYGEHGGKDPMKKEFISNRIKRLYHHALKNPDKKFLVEFTSLDALMTMYPSSKMASMFSEFAIPDNIVFEENFNRLII